LRAPKLLPSGVSSQLTNRCVPYGPNTAYEVALHTSCAYRPYVDFGLPRRSLSTRSRARSRPNSSSHDLLPLYPLAGAATDDPTIRRMIARPYPYLIFYEITDNEIVIHAVRHGAREPPDEMRSE
jgi:plasmid stabilization system protein ParE